MTDLSVPRGSADAHPTTETLADYAEDLLPPGTTGKVAAHLDGCAECRRDLGRLAAVTAALSTAPDPGPVPADVAAGVAAALAAAGEARETPWSRDPAGPADVPADVPADLAGRRRRGWPRLLLAAAAGAVVALAGSTALTGQIAPDVVAGGGDDSAESSAADMGAPSVQQDAAGGADGAPGAEAAPEEGEEERALTAPSEARGSGLPGQDELARLVEEAAALPGESAGPGQEACGQRLAAELDRPVLAAGSSEVGGRPVVLVVLPDPAGSGPATTAEEPAGQLWVLPSCADGPAAALAVLPVPLR